ncbi:hypothetical protein ACFX15_034033 [Malus domestica]
MSDRSQYLPLPYGQLSNQNPLLLIATTAVRFSVPPRLPCSAVLLLNAVGMPRTQSSPPELRGVQDEVADKLGFEKVSEDFFGDCSSNAVVYSSATKRSAPKSCLCPTTTTERSSELFSEHRREFSSKNPFVFMIDSTGVADILQQSVLCGSRKYPVKKPFDELVRGSFSTSLHAKTMADRTYYSGSCTTTKELYNMVDVHLDAVFFPKCLEDVQIFQQQGVVFNQRKEFYSRPLPEDILKLTAQQASFPSTLSSNRLLFMFVESYSLVHPSMLMI